MPTAAHVIYIPAMLMLGVIIGYTLGSRAARDAFAHEQARKEARAARRAAREREAATPETSNAESGAAKPPAKDAN